MMPTSVKLHPEAAGPLPDLGVVLCAGCWNGSRARCRDLWPLTKMLRGDRATRWGDPSWAPPQGFGPDSHPAREQRMCSLCK